MHSTHGSSATLPLLSPRSLSPRSGSPRASGSNRRGRIVSVLFLVVAFALILVQQETFIRSAGLSGQSLINQADSSLAASLRSLADAVPYNNCSATELQATGMHDFAPTADVFLQLNDLPSTAGPLKGNKFVEVLIKDVPCWGNAKCCQSNSYLRPSKKDDQKSFGALYQRQELAIFYGIFANYTPQYILEAGTGPGYASQLFKLLWPRAVLVAVEPNPGNFESLMLNTREVDGVHAVHAGLWKHRSTLRQVDKKGFLMLAEAKTRKALRSGHNIKGYSVENLKQMFDIPFFDFVYLDMEGSEVEVFGRGADLKWLDSAKVIAIKMHEKLGKYFGVEGSLVAEVSAAFAGKDFHVVVDGTHVILISREMLKKIPGGVDLEGVPQPPADIENEKAPSAK